VRIWAKGEIRSATSIPAGTCVMDFESLKDVVWYCGKKFMDG